MKKHLFIFLIFYLCYNLNGQQFKRNTLFSNKDLTTSVKIAFQSVPHYNKSMRVFSFDFAPLFFSYKGKFSLKNEVIFGFKSYTLNYNNIDLGQYLMYRIGLGPKFTYSINRFDQIGVSLFTSAKWNTDTHESGYFITNHPLGKDFNTLRNEFFTTSYGIEVFLNLTDRIRPSLMFGYTNTWGYEFLAKKNIHGFTFGMMLELHDFYNKKRPIKTLEEQAEEANRTGRYPVPLRSPKLER